MTKYLVILQKSVTHILPAGSFRPPTTGFYPNNYPKGYRPIKNTN
jgi:hypothetical protein